ncbi:MAG: hypothetical protein U5R49_22045 [Deltaproteobacteria bacterium]|nr:hypothetical protein [Deltaproteobacteria bacterium]
MKAVRELERQGYHIELQGDRIRMEIKAGFAPDAERVQVLLQEIRGRKPEAVDFLRRREDVFQVEVDKAVSQVNELWDRSGCRMLGVPQSTRDKAFHLEGRITEAANAGDYPKARDALERWRGCWVPPDYEQTEMFQ